MTDQLRPRGRRSLLRGIGLALLALVAPGAATAAGETPAPATGGADVPISWIDNGGGAASLAAAPDGRLWVLRRGADGNRLQRVGAGGVESETALAQWPRTALTTLNDGRLGYLHATDDKPYPSDYERATVSGAEAPVATALPPFTSTEAGLAPDGAVWRVAACKRATRVGLDGAVRSFRLSCATPSGDPRLAFGGDGSTWLVDLCAGRIERFAADGARRLWRPKPVETACGDKNWGGADVSPAPVVLLPSDDGGLSYGLVGTAGGRIGPGGRLVRGSSTLLAASTSDGSTWSTDGAALVRRAADGAVTTIPDPAADGRPLHHATVDADGRLWFSRAASSGWRAEWTIGDTSVAIADPGTRTVRSFDDRLAGRGAHRRFPSPLTAAAGGTVWGSVDDSWSQAPGQAGLLRFAAVPEPAAGGARPRRVVARSGATAWLQVRCDAALGSFCATRATLTRRGGDAALATVVPAVVPGGASRTVAVKLTAAARKTLHAGRTLRADALVVGEGQEPARLAVALAPRR
ncbi:hypothetical protein VSS74_20305 [Conexibacter stalactiti]|uniref:Uncharacterized protein n=1 Tax=Conexibacter stalactiti TaxID=1940611 RepID=A0ABU4HTR3_9ACTN|nr:hypothetical protein [Conexibacter stalactiti]MDW5596702.1 hypothetical protein [Conexibacter stalactiti]MEC5037344.1 hypothetical protein [Conexibacter stalactiti]